MGQAECSSRAQKLLAAARMPIWREMLDALGEPLTAAELAERLDEPIEIAEGHARVLAGMGCVERVGEDRYRATVRADVVTEGCGIAVTVAPRDALRPPT
jgi:DNA-binding transcriptional ArsR family regulator